MQKVISCDGHVVEPLAALPAGAVFLGNREQILVLPKGYTQVPLPVWTSVVNGKIGQGALGLQDCPGAWQAEAREAHCREQGVGAEILYPTFAVAAVETAESYRLVEVAAGAYNVWVAETFKAPMFHPLYLAPAWDAERLVMELDEAVDREWVGVLLPQRPSDPERRWRDFVGAFKLAAAAGLPVHWHAFTRPSPESFSKEPLAQAWEGVRAAQDILLELILGGVFQEVPTLKVVFAEMDVGWVPHFTGRLQRLVDRYGSVLCTPTTVTDIARIMAEQVWFAVQDPREADLLAPHTQALWGWDYPHADAVGVGILDGPEGAAKVSAAAVKLYPRLAGSLR